MKTFIVLAMHGAPALDFPREKLHEFLGLHSHTEHHHGGGDGHDERYHELETEIRSWPRTEKNDPFYNGAKRMADELKEAAGMEVVLGFNEFCAPSIEGAIEEAVKSGAEKIVVITPMMTQGGEHAGRDIPDALNRSRRQFPDVEIRYVWPFDSEEVAQFLASQVRKFV